MKKYALIFLTMMLWLSACRGPLKGEGPAVEERRSISKCSKFILSLDADVEYHVSDSTGLLLIAPANFMKEIKTESGSDKLHIRNNRMLDNEDKIRVILYSPSFEKIEINGSGKIITAGSIHSEKLSLQINGSGDFNGSLYGKNMITTINGSGRVVLSGKTQFHEVEINGSGDLLADSLMVENYELSIRGSGDASIQAISKLNAEVIGSGNITYSGQPVVQTKITGSGDVRKISN
jgi:hypothetical protein